MKDLQVSLVIQAIDKATEPLRRVQASVRGLEAVTAGLGVAGSRIAGIGADVLKFGSIAGGVGAAVGGAFTRSVIETAAQFERFGAILETTEGSAEKARAALDWANQFANTTPYEIAEVTDAFVKLRSYGLDPMHGLLQSLGDTSAAMSKPLSEAVEAIADAVTGENERLKAFGITASKSGSKITYEWTENGKQLRRTVDANNRAIIQSTLQAIMNARYAGSMERLSKTWDGVLSNISGHWTTFQLRVGEAGAFTGLKGELGGLLAALEKMEKSGELQRLAKIIGGDMTEGLNAAGAGFRELISSSGGVEGFARDVGGAMRTVGEAVGGVAKVIKEAAEGFDRLSRVVPGLDSFRQTGGLNLDKPIFEARPGGAIAGVMDGLGIGDNWFVSRPPTLSKAAQQALSRGVRGRSTTAPLAALPAPAALAPSVASIAGTGQAPSAAAIAGRAQASRVEVGGKVTVAIESDQRVRVKRLESSNIDLEAELRRGPLMGGY